MSDRRNLRYSFGDEVKREFNIEYKDGKYLYKIQEILDPFRSYNISVKGYKNFKYTPQLSCKYLSKSKPKDILSLYDESNHLKLIPNFVSREDKKVVLQEGKNGSLTQASNMLIPIYGDGVRFGLLSKGVKLDELTIDKEFSLEVAKIFNMKIKRRIL